MIIIFNPVDTLGFGEREEERREKRRCCGGDTHTSRGVLLLLRDGSGVRGHGCKDLRYGTGGQN